MKKKKRISSVRVPNYNQYLQEFNTFARQKLDFHFFGRVENCEDSNYLTDCQKCK